MYSVYGGWIGVPSNYYYKSAEDIDKVNIYIRNEKVKWNSEHGKMLEESLILSESEQIFAFCRSLMDLQSYKLYWKTITPSAVFLSIYFAGQKINQGENLYGRRFMVRSFICDDSIPWKSWKIHWNSLQVRYFIYALLGAFGYGLSSFITDFFNFQHERNVDIEIANLGPGKSFIRSRYTWIGFNFNVNVVFFAEMIEAGVSFYTKLLNRNIAIREISGLDLYTAKGNENYSLRIRSIPLTVRKAFLESKLEELRKTEDEATVNQEETSAADQDETQSWIRWPTVDSLACKFR